MKSKYIALTFIISFIVSPCFSLSKASQVSDSGKLYPTNVTIITYPTTTKQIQEIVQHAHAAKKKVSIAGARYSQGGQSNATDSINIDLSRFNKLIQINKVQKIVKVQPGMTWEQLQNILQPLNLSVKVMQSSNVFSIGGSASVNVHGRDLRYGPMIETINSCTIINPAGEIQHLSRTENPELFSLVIGGYGLFGIIIEIELSLTDNPICYKEQEIIPYQKYIHHFSNEILTNPNINLYYGRFVMIPGDNYLQEVISVSYLVDHHKNQIKRQPLRPETSITWNQLLFNAYRKNQGKTISWLRHNLEMHSTAPWETGKFTCRNQLMRPYVHSLDNNNPKSTDLLQEYFIPVAQFTQFTDQLRTWSQSYNIKLLNVTLRFVPQNSELFLSYAQSDMIAFVLYFTTDLDHQSIEIIKQYTKKLTGACLQTGGTLYLPYQQFASSQAIHTSYPMLQDFIAKKKLYDPEETFTSNWYANYVARL